MIEKRLPFSVINRPEDLAPSTISVLNGSMFVDIFKKVPGLKVETASSIKQNIMKVIYHRVDYCFDTHTTPEYVVKTQLPKYADQIKIIYYLPHSGTIYIAISKKTPNDEKVMRDFNKALNEMKEDGTYQKIIKKYGITYYVPEF